LRLNGGSKPELIFRVQGSTVLDFPGDVLIFFRFNLLSLFQLFQYEVNVKAEGDQGVGKVAHDAYGIGAVISDDVGVK
jgi:hypothetical protein